MKSFAQRIMAVATITLSLSVVAGAKSLEEARAEIKDMAFAADLHKVATTNPNWRLRADAVYFMTDEALLKQILVTDKDPRVQAAALFHLTDQTVLEGYALDTKKPVILRAVATSKLVNRAVLERLSTDPEPKVRAMALANLPAPFEEAHIVPIPEVSIEDILYKE